MKEALNDKKQVFLLYTIFCGDASKTAHALGTDVLSVAKLAEKEGWDEKVGEIAQLRKSDRPGDLERAINRAINYTDAHRYRQQLQRVLAHFQTLTDAEIEELLISETYNKDGVLIKKSLSTRALADLSSALEKAHALTYLALGDTAQDRARRKEEQDDGVMAASVLNQQIIQAMTEKGGGQLEDSPKNLLEEEQQKRAEEIAIDEAMAEDKKPPQPEAPAAEQTFVVPPIKPRTKAKN